MKRQRSVREGRVEGFGLLEVLIALAVLGIGILAYTQLQARAVLFTSQAEGLRTLTRVAEAEIAWQQLNAVGTYASFTFDDDAANPYLYPCDSDLPGNVSCSFEVFPCGVNAAGAFSCSRSTTNAQAYEIVVYAEDNRDNELTLRSISTGQYIAGITSGTGSGSGGDGTGDDGTGDDGSGDDTADDGTGDDDQPGNRPPNVGGGPPPGRGNN